MAGPVHLRPTAPLAPRVLLPGDPGRALLLAQALLHEPRMFNHHRGLWGYTGAAEDGAPLTIQATGMGGPSAAIVVRELVDLGARALVRVGTCGSLVPELRLGALVIATEALAGDGTSRALGAGDSVPADPELLAALRAANPEAAAGPVATTDLFYDAPPPPDGALAVEMEAATVLQLARRLGVPGACVLGVSDELAAGERVRIDDAGLERLGEAVGRAGAAALLARAAA
ncbi:MAG: purine-nucleoside phosphorylase [Actinobacteria bacterium]|nr:MAG: purine-nucleoside phosphorylase [Actinomycetota bacterium]